MNLKNVTNVLPKSGEAIKTKYVIISDSITKRVDMIELNNHINNGNAVKRAYPGTTASQINSYVPAIIKKDLPDTNNLCWYQQHVEKKANM